MATHSGILAWRIPWIEEPGGLQSLGFAKCQTRLNQLSTHACTPILIYRERKEVALNGCQDISGTLVKGLQIH